MRRFVWIGAAIGFLAVLGWGAQKGWVFQNSARDGHSSDVAGPSPSETAARDDAANQVDAAGLKSANTKLHERGAPQASAHARLAVQPVAFHRGAELVRQFQEYSGARLVFHSAELPPGQYHDLMPPLSAAGQERAAEICLAEVKKYPPGFLQRVNLEAVGVFASCASKQGDGFRPYDADLKGYRFYGIWNGQNAVAGAFYSEGQLPLTFHHEIFHHIDGTSGGKTDFNLYFAADDKRFRAATSGGPYYGPLKLPPADLAALKRLGAGARLKESVSEYAAKSAGEDQAETARYFLSHLPDALVQMAEAPELPGSQRLLHVLQQYEESIAGGPNAQWFVSVALGRAEREAAPAPATLGQALAADALLTKLRGYAERGRSGWDGVAGREAEARATLAEAARLSSARVSPALAREIALQAAEVTHQLVRSRLKAAGENDERYAIWGTEDAAGVNWTLRHDVAAFGDDARQLRELAPLAAGAEDRLASTQLKGLRLVARYYDFIRAQWAVSSGTKAAFESAREAYANSLPAAQNALAKEIKRTPLEELARRIPESGELRLLEAPRAELPRATSGVPRGFATNRYLAKVDAVVDDAAVRAAIRAVQPACVRLGTASGCCISPNGIILTAAHVPARKGARLATIFPDGREYTSTCVAINTFLDMAVMQIEGIRGLPYAPIAAAAPEAGDWVCCIGQPGSTTPGGAATNYQPFHVSAGSIRGYKERDRLGYQMLGGVKHDAWTYWGHSGAPLFNKYGEIVATHNSWDSTTAMRHGVTHEAIVHFLKQAKIEIGAANE